MLKSDHKMIKELVQGQLTNYERAAVEKKNIKKALGLQRNEFIKEYDNSQTRISEIRDSIQKTKL